MSEKENEQKFLREVMGCKIYKVSVIYFDFPFLHADFFTLFYVYTVVGNFY